MKETSKNDKTAQENAEILPQVNMAYCKASAEYYRSSLDSRFQTLLEHLPALRENSVDGIHDARVATRRLRAALSEFSPYLDKQLLAAFMQRIRTTTKLLGRPRELDVMDAMLAKFKLQLKGPWLEAAEHAHKSIQKSRNKSDTHRIDAIGVLEAPDFTTAFTELLASCRNSDVCMLETPPLRLLKRLDALRKKYRHWQHSNDEPHLHEVRIAYKKLRYTCELYEPLYGEEMNAFVKTLKHLQEALGDWNDWRVLRDEIEGMSHTASYRAVQGYPLLIEQLDVQGKRRLDVFEQHDADYHASMNNACKLLKNAVAPCCQWKENT